MSTHTPGPWSTTPMQSSIWANDGETKIATIADLPWVTTASGRRTSDFMTENANARLIAAAPELLDALIEMLDASNKPANERWLSNVRSNAIAAIAKATGESQL